jgi:hypothetical protein
MTGNQVTALETGLAEFGTDLTLKQSKFAISHTVQQKAEIRPSGSV